MEYRIGLGHDTHRLGPGEGLILGGVPIAHDRCLIGHSDADVLLHAITDAVLGAVALGDIGEFFPDTDPANRGRDSAQMLRLAWERVAQQGWSLVNLDAVVLAQRPKLLPYKTAIRQRIGEILGVEPERIGLKAKTGEAVGPVGREEAVVCETVALLMRKASGAYVENAAW